MSSDWGVEKDRRRELAIGKSPGKSPASISDSWGVNGAGQWRVKSAMKKRVDGSLDRSRKIE